MNELNISKQSGFSIVELMIAGLLGLFLIAGVIQLFIGSNRNYTMQEQLAIIQEDGRFALMFLEDQLELSGWDNDITQGASFLAVNLAASSDGINDTITVSNNRAVNGIDNVDCNGAVIDDGLVINTFSVNINNELVCSGNGGGSQPLISGVSNFQILYGVETDLTCPDGVVNRYMTRTEVNAANLSDQILSVRMAFLLASNGNVLPTAQEEEFQVLDQNSQFNDQILRRLFQQTIFMPNAAYKLLTSSDVAVKCM